MSSTSSESPSTSQYVEAVAHFAVASVGMMLGNKVAIAALPLPSVLVLLQVFATIALLQIFGIKPTSSGKEARAPKAALPSSRTLQPLNVKTLRSWAPIAVLFATMMYTSTQSLLHVTVTSVLIFRNLATLITTVVDFTLRGLKEPPQGIAAEILILIGAVLYGGASASLSWIGLFWSLANVSAQVAYGVHLKRAIDTQPAVKDMSKFTMSYYNNVTAIVPLLLVAVAQGEVTRAPAMFLETTLYGWGAVLGTCLMGFFISTAGFGLQRIISATAFLVVNNCTKFINIALGIVLLGEKVATVSEFCGCALALLGGAWYGWASLKKKK